MLPFLLIPLGLSRGFLSGDPLWLGVLTAVLCAWGVYVVWLMVRRPDDLARTENHPSWTHMYLMMMFAQVGFAVAYLV